MSLKTWWSERKRRRGAESASKELIKEAPLREFVYLDAVSLHSLLVSQNSTIPDNVSEAITRADEAEIAGMVKADALAVKSEVSSRYQTSNSNSTQSSRKAVIQTLFKEFRDLPLEFKLVQRKEAPEPFDDLASVARATDASTVNDAASFTRGTLIEIEVELAVDPVYRLGAMMTEWTAMADDYPAMFGTQGLLGFLRDSEPVMRVLDRFLAGLVPIKAKAVHHVVVAVDGREFVVDKRAIDGLDVEYRPLSIVGVTEKLGYWRDLRRVLFSNARFTVLGRVARDGIHDKWTPVKLADLFSAVAPDFVDQINAIREPSAAGSATASNPQQVALSSALRSYKEELVEQVEEELSPEKADEVDALIDLIGTNQSSPAAQRRAFDQVKVFVDERIGQSQMNPDEDLAARQRARESAGLELFPAFANLSPTTATAPTSDTKKDERMLDVEVIGIYW